jgi:hypothetical protein
MAEPEYIEGEEWKELPGWGYWVSNFGRVVGRSGHLLSQRLNFRSPTVALRRPGKGPADYVVGRLVMTLFRPDTPYSPRRTVFLNGDETDCRAANMAPGRRDQSALWKEAADACPTWLEPHERQDLISEVVVMLMEGSATDAAEAFKIARRRYNQVMGKWKERSMDAPLGPDGGSLHDVIEAP